MTSESHGARSGALPTLSRSATADEPAGEGRTLTDRQAAFVIAYTTDPTSIGDAAEAARRAGYSGKSAKDLGRRLVALPHVRTAIFEANQRQISGQIATKAIALLERVIGDESVLMKTRVEAARTILDRAGLGAVGAGQAKPWAEKHPSEMTDDELSRYFFAAKATLDRMRAQPAEIIDVTAAEQPGEDAPAPALAGPTEDLAPLLSATPDSVHPAERVAPANPERN